MAFLQRPIYYPIFSDKVESQANFCPRNARVGRFYRHDGSARLPSATGVMLLHRVSRYAISAEMRPANRKLIRVQNANCVRRATASKLPPIGVPSGVPAMPPPAAVENRLA